MLLKGAGHASPCRRWPRSPARAVPSGRPAATANRFAPALTGSAPIRLKIFLEAQTSIYRGIAPDSARSWQPIRSLHSCSALVRTRFSSEMYRVKAPGHHRAGRWSRRAGRGSWPPSPGMGSAGYLPPYGISTVPAPMVESKRSDQAASGSRRLGPLMICLKSCQASSKGPWLPSTTFLGLPVPWR